MLCFKGNVLKNEIDQSNNIMLNDIYFGEKNSAGAVERAVKI